MKSLSLFHRGLREKLAVAFALMSVVPLLVLGYVVANYIFPERGPLGDLSLVVGLAAFISLLGFWVVKKLVAPVIRMAQEARGIAAGDWSGRVRIDSADEIGQLGAALNQITARVQENMSQLRTYGEQVRDLNLEINQRMIALSHLLQVSNLIGQSARLDEVMRFILDKLTHLEEAQLACLMDLSGEEDFVVRMACGGEGVDEEPLLHRRLRAPGLKRVLARKQTLVLDGRSADSTEGKALRQFFGLPNVVVLPLSSAGQGHGLLVCGNAKPDFTFPQEVLDLLRVFAKQMGIAIENDLLQRKAEALQTLDELTGLYNDSYMQGRLEEEVQRAARYHRSCALVLIDLDNFRNLQELYGQLVAERALKQVGALLKREVTEVDRVGRMGWNEFAMILPERNKKEAIALAEKIRQRISARRFQDGHSALPGGLTASAGVSENPLDGATAEELFKKAASALTRAKAEGKNRVVIA